MSVLFGMYEQKLLDDSHFLKAEPLNTFIIIVCGCKIERKKLKR